MKKKWLLVAGITVLFVALTTTAFATKPIKLVVNGTEIKPDVPPQIINGRTMVPIRFIAELFGAEVNWNENSQTVFIERRSGWSNYLEKKLTIEDIKKKYTDRKIINIINYKDYVLVESQRDYPEASQFDWYNLRTGDMDILPTSPNYAQLVKVITEDKMLFVTNGKNDVSPHSTFPFYIECYRGEENVNSQYDFRDRYITKYLSVDQGVHFGNKDDEVISDIKVTLTGIEVLFEPVKGKEAKFYTAYTTIPHTKTKYIKDKHQFVIEFEKTGISQGLASKSMKTSQDSYYIKSVKFLEKSDSSIVMVNLKDTAKFYTADIKKIIDNDLPFVQFSFSGKEENIY